MLPMIHQPPEEKWEKVMSVVSLVPRPVRF